jgi:tRNA 2-thiocytidine biosynthesis protein TtcA
MNQPGQSAPDKLRRKLARTMTKTISAWNLVEAGDKVMVAVSGGKDSYTLLDLLWQAKRRAPFDFEVVAVHLDQKQPGYDGTSLRAWLEAFGAPFEILEEDTYSTVLDQTRAGKTYCAVCSRMRRGVLYTAAERLGCNKIALGHHRDDALETLLMNLFFSGKLQAMPATYRTDDGRFEVIRPLMDIAERDIIEHSEHAAYPILPCNLCGSQSGLQRQKMRALLNELESTHNDVRAVMANALRNVHPSHLLDADVAKVWAERPEDVRPAKSEPVPSSPSPNAKSGDALVQLRRLR